MIDDLDLLLQHRNAPGEVVMLPDFPCQLVQFGVGDGLLRVQLACTSRVVLLLVMITPQQRQTAGDESYDDCFHSVISFLLWGYVIRWYHLLTPHFSLTRSETIRLFAAKHTPPDMAAYCYEPSLRRSHRLPCFG